MKSKPKIFDAHCDVLMKMFLNPNLSFYDSEKLHLTNNQLMNVGSKVQCFAIYIPERIHPSMRFHAALTMVELFYENVLKAPNMKLVKSHEDIKLLGEGDIGAVLTLEGCDCIGEDLLKLKTLLRLGVSSVGLTWNHSNAVADGVLEPRGGGLSAFGHNVVSLLKETNTWCDVSHLSVQGFWDVMEQELPTIASHSNCHSICSNPRNLNDEQITSLIKKDSVIGITFVPEFLNSGGNASIKDVMKHIEHVCSLGGEDHVGFGSDFDGIDKVVKGLEKYQGYELLMEELNKHYSTIQVENFLLNNFSKRFPVRAI
ncbi:dipeptidase [Peribacillus alkalitolerans]|uniref:dipeptidase n=1 Tax=Peribacillus alkalitolerans TaxID=1550385 RepID=UPI0013D04AE2|nr:dipeptidase [Peribacillus alkalitolerans]